MQTINNRYRIERKLGAGGMGVVYLARDTRLQRQVAIKKLRKDATSESAHLRIQREARLLAKLNHNNIVRLYDIVEERDGIALIMEYVEGCTLRQWLRDRQPSLKDKLGILLQICKGLEQAHALGIVHRDLKPDNILIDGDSIARITDFGIAKSWHQDSDLTREQHIAGSWGLMSPEQAQGKPLDNRSDLFTLGMLAYQMLCGQNPFGDGDNTYVTLERIVRRPHPPAARLNPELPDTLCKLLDRLMAKNPQRRPDNIGEVSAALGDIIDELGEGPPGQPADSAPGITITAETFHRKNERKVTGRATVMAATATAILVASALFYLSGPPGKKVGQYIALVLPEIPAESPRKIRMLHNNVLSAIREGLSNRKGLYFVPISESRALRGKPLERIAGALNVQLLLQPEIACRENACDLSLQLIDTQDLSTVANRSFTLDPDSYLDGYTKTRQQLSYLLPDYPLRQPRPELKISEADYRRYLELEAIHPDEKLLPALEALQERAPFYAPIYQLHAQNVFEVRFRNVDLDAVERLENLLARAPAEIADTPELINAALILAETQHDWAAADRQLERLKVALPDRGHYHHRKAIDYQLRGDYENGLQAIERALSHRTGTKLLLQKAIALSDLGKLEDARPLLEQILAIDSGNMDAISLLAANALDMGQTGKTIRLLQSVGPSHLNPLDTYNLCTAYYLQEDFGEAAPCFEGLSALNPHDSEPLLFRAEMARAGGQREVARRLTERTIEETSGRDGWENKLILALALAQLGDHQKSVETLIQVRQQAPDDTYSNHIYAQIYFTTGDLLLASSHIRRTLELGQSPRWYRTRRFAGICSLPDFADLRADYPALCAGTTEGTHTAQK